MSDPPAPVRDLRPPGRLRHPTARGPLTYTRIAASWVVPVSSPPIREGAVLINPAGRIEMVGRDADVPSPDDVRAERFPDAAILPGLVNTHTHLELTGLGGQLEEPTFFDWIQQIRGAKERATPEWFLESARQGVRDTWRFGTTTVGDTGDSGAVVRALAEMGGAGVAYHEVFGPHPDQVGSAMAELATAVDALRSEAGSRVRVGVSPHAPYTVSPPLYRAVADYAREQDLPVAMHLAESRAEVALVTAAKGAFADAWHRRDIPAPATARSAVGYVLPTGILDCRPLVIHAVQVDDDDVRVLADAGATVTVCPGSNRAHGHGDPPVRQIRAMGLPLGVGTDSVASVGSLDLFREARLAVEIGGLTADEGLALMTAGGAAAMGLDAEVGSVDIGKWADLCLIEVPDVAQSEVAAVLLGSEPGRILRTYGAGRCLYARSVPSPSSMPHTPSPE